MSAKTIIRAPLRCLLRGPFGYRGRRTGTAVSERRPAGAGAGLTVGARGVESPARWRRLKGVVA